ncbi:hypothetical protein ACS0TY_011550 [Phlomoides rotata]
MMPMKRVVVFKEEQIADEKGPIPGCNLFPGKWVYDNVSYRLYKEEQCSYMGDKFRDSLIRNQYESMFCLIKSYPQLSHTSWINHQPEDNLNTFYSKLAICCGCLRSNCEINEGIQYYNRALLGTISCGVKL